MGDKFLHQNVSFAEISPPGPISAKQHCDFKSFLSNNHEVPHVSMPRGTYGTSGSKGNVAVSQWKIIVIIRNYARRVIRPCSNQI